MSSSNYKNIKIGWNKGKIEYTSSQNNSFWQSPLWAEILGKTHQARDIIVCSGESGEIFLERRTIIGKYTGLYALGVDGNEINEELLEYIGTEIRENNDLFLQIEPIDFVEVKSEKWKVKRRGWMRALLSTFYLLPSTFTKAPFRRFIEPVTAVLKIHPWEGGGVTNSLRVMKREKQVEGGGGVLEEEKLFASFAEKGRYNIRLAQKRWITTRWVKVNETCPLEKGGTKGGLWKEKTYLEAFYQLLAETTERDWFSWNSLSYYQHFIETLEAHDAGWLLIAERDGVLHAAGVFVYWGDEAIYYYGASSSDREIRRDMATYLLQWEAIREGMKRHCKTYDFLGISEDGTGKLAWVTEFKLRFNPEKVRLPSELVVVYKPILLKVLQIVSRLRKMFR
jgi:lipid II:glycine glycyltransferase (peptidoglycan interpeptide bridge formation enzyme)